MSNRSVLMISPRIKALPVVHGSGDFMLYARQIVLNDRFDCIAVPLPESFRSNVEQGIDLLPCPNVAIQNATPNFETEWRLETDNQESDGHRQHDVNGELATCSYVPIDPCQPVIAALRMAMGEHIRREYIDLETSQFLPVAVSLPDPYALKQVSIEQFSAAVLPSLPAPTSEQSRQRIAYMANRLRGLEKRYDSILFLVSIFDWPWIRQAYQEQWKVEAEPEFGGDVQLFGVESATLLFVLGELPFITGLYEQARSELSDDENLSVDGVKELLLAARESYRNEFGKRARRLTPHTLATCLKYVRNLSLIDKRLTPDLYSLVIAGKQIAGDQFAMHVAETARQYPFGDAPGLDQIAMGIHRSRLPNGEVVEMVNRLPGAPVVWRSCQLKRRPEKLEKLDWQMRWNQFSQCSYTPEDEQIENFRAHVFDRARTIMVGDLARTEKFTTSIQDGIDVRETLRNWYTGEIYVKVLPPGRGDLDCAVMLFDSPADPRDYPWRTTWYSEHDWESTLAFFASDFRKEPVGPGICQATYGGALFLFPPIAIPDIWNSRRFDFCETLEERLLAAACMFSRHSQIALVSGLPPGAAWRRLAKRFKRRLVHVPLGQFGESTIQQLRQVHVLNGKHVRSYAAHFIRRP